MTNFPEQLKQLRISKNISQKEVAVMLEMADRQYRRYENGEVDTPLTIASTLAIYFDVSLDYLTGRTDKPEVNK